MKIQYNQSIYVLRHNLSFTINFSYCTYGNNTYVNICVYTYVVVVVVLTHIVASRKRNFTDYLFHRIKSNHRDDATTTKERSEVRRHRFEKLSIVKDVVRNDWKVVKQISFEFSIQCLMSTKKKENCNGKTLGNKNDRMKINTNPRKSFGNQIR